MTRGVPAAELESALEELRGWRYRRFRIVCEAGRCNIWASRPSFPYR